MTALVIGVGHRFRGDDAVGPLVADRIADLVAARGLSGVEVIEHHGEGTDLMERWSGHARVVVVDATCAEADAGTVRRWDAAAAPLPAGLFPKGSHVFGLAEGVEMARLLGRLPERMTIFGIAGLAFTAGAPLSPQVDLAADRVASEVIELLLE